MTTIGFIGLGRIGQKLALNLVTSGFDVVVRDADQAAATPLLSAGATWGYSAKDIAQQSEIVITFSDSQGESSALMEGPNGVIAGLSEGSLWIEMSPTESSELARLARLVSDTGAMALDAPVTGYGHQAQEGNVSIMVGGTVDAFEIALPVLQVMGAEIVHTGDLGTASVMAVVSSYLAGVQLAATGEALMVAKRAGIELEAAYAAIKASSGNSYMHETAGLAILNGSYNGDRTMQRHLKDATTFDELGKTLDIPLELSPMLVQILQDGEDEYGADARSPMLVKRLEEACQTDLRASGTPTDQ